ncbi:MAG: S-methyl-5'-thioadenosine phosphorylase [bacterium]|nr:S-methyl-5'-thioadenosine phosphorylase [bacterium]
MTESTPIARIAVIGGSGLYNMPEITDKVTVTIDTPFGRPSGDITIGTLRGKRVAFLPRHGVGHVYTPTTVPYRANIYALKTLGVSFIIGVNACGSLREDYAPGHIVIPDQLFDHTKADRGRSFFDTGLVGHVSVAEPFCPELSEQVFRAVQQVGGTVHKGGTFIIIEGPRFSTRGESHIYRQWGCSLIGMTTAPEAFLASEAEIAYATMAHITDYDVWHEHPVTVEMVMETMKHNLETAQQAIAAAVEGLDENAVYACHSALQNAIMTSRGMIPPEMVERLRPIVGHYVGQSI